MAQLLHQTNIRQELLSLFKTAENFIFLVSPFIKLNDEMKRSLIRKKDDIKFEIVVLFGKNEHDLSKSLSKDDMEFFKQFQNVSIYHNTDLHAKYYANESKTIITSLNLHQYSVRNNYEIGVMIERKFIDLSDSNRLDSEAFDYINFIISDSEPVYKHQTKQESFFFGFFKGKITKELDVDVSDEIYSNQQLQSVKNYPKQTFSNQSMGYCIRTGKSIPFNVKKPFTKEAFESWNKFQNPDFKEKFCHFSGEPSDGTISFSKPILRKNWNKAKEFMN